ncbi:MAG: hypothetical protein ACI87W_000153 [Halieaceae bacterium]|jgi:uncharacterized protein (TIGR00369 family)
MAASNTPPAPNPVPEGFEQLPRGLGFGDLLQPFYRRVVERDVNFGLYVAEQHLNMMGICHGGALMTLADIAAATSIHLQRENPVPSPTINLSFDFMSPGKAGRWLQTRSDHVQAKRHFGFCSGVIHDGDTVVLRYSGVFYASDRPAAAGDNNGARAMALLVGDDRVPD